MKEIIFFTPYDKQIEVIEALEDPEIDTVILCAGRQAGKTIIAENIAVKWCLDAPKDKPVTVMWLSPTDSQANKVYKEIIKIFTKKSPVVKTIKGAKGDTEMVFVNNSQIIFRSAGSGNTLRGNTVHYLIVDEAAFISEEIIEDVLPTMNVTGRKKFFISTPKGKNYFHKYYLNGLSNVPAFDSWKSFHFNCYDSPFITDKKIEEYKAISTDVKFQQEYLAEFVDNASAFKNINDVMTITNYDRPLAGEKYYAGVDIGLGTDASVISIIDQYGNFVKYFRWEETQAQNVIDNIIDLNKIWKFKKILFETNNNGKPMYQQLKKTLSNIDEFSTQTKSKSEIINNLIVLFDRKAIRILEDSYLKIELEAFNFKINDGGTVKFGAASGFHDDVIMSFAIARLCYDRNKYNGKYIGFF